jgi:hypothetical protein
MRCRSSPDPENEVPRRALPLLALDLVQPAHALARSAVFEAEQGIGKMPIPLLSARQLFIEGF